MRYIPNILLAILAVLCTAPSLYAQRQQDLIEWPSVTVVLAQGDTLTGHLTYYRAEDVLHLRSEAGSTTLTPVLVNSFQVNSDVQPRYFYTYLWNRGRDYSDYRSPSFFEQLSYGKYALLKRETLRQDIVRNDPFWSPYGTGGFYGPGYGNPYWVASVQELFYILTPKGNIVTLRNPKKDLARVFSSHNKLIKQYVRENDLRYNRRQDLVRIVNYYNSLVDPNGAKSGVVTER